MGQTLSKEEFEKKYGSQTQKPAADSSDVDTEAVDKVSEGGLLQAALLQGAQGFYGGFTDEMGGGLRAMAGEGEYADERDKRRRLLDETEEQYPITSGASKLVGFLAGPGKLLNGGALNAGLISAASGLGESEADLTEGEYADAAMDTGVAGISGALLQKGLNLIGGKAPKVSSGKKGTIDPFVSAKKRGLGSKPDVKKGTIDPFSSAKRKAAAKAGAKSPAPAATATAPTPPGAEMDDEIAQKVLKEVITRSIPGGGLLRAAAENLSKDNLKLLGRYVKDGIQKAAKSKVPQGLLNTNNKRIRE